jgi:hypothetical protein
VGGAVYLGVLVVTLLGLVLVILDQWRAGLATVGGAMLCGALARLVLRQSDAGMLGVRRKLVDVTTLATLGAGLVVLAVVIPDQPLL